jgi:hypothetical protein
MAAAERPLLAVLSDSGLIKLDAALRIQSATLDDVLRLTRDDIAGKAGHGGSDSGTKPANPIFPAAVGSRVAHGRRLTGLEPPETMPRPRHTLYRRKRKIRGVGVASVARRPGGVALKGTRMPKSKAKPNAPQRPNVLLVMADQFRFPRFSYGERGMLDPIKYALGLQGSGSGAAEPTPEQREMYDLEHDPNELVNLLVYDAPFPTPAKVSGATLDTKAVAGEAKRLRELMAKLEARMLSTGAPAYPPPETADTTTAGRGAQVTS